MNQNGSDDHYTASDPPGMQEPSVTSVTSVPKFKQRDRKRENDGGFPMHSLAPDMADMVEAVAQAARVPDILPACCALAAVSASIGKGLVIRSASYRTTPANLFIIASALSGSGKSETFQPMMQPIFEFQHRLIEDWREKVRPEFMAMKLVVDARLAKLKAEAAMVNEPDDLREIARELAKFTSAKEKMQAEDSEPVLMSEDVTTEKLALLLARNHETMFSASSDGGAVLNNLLGRYSRNKRTDENLFLKGYSGDSVRVDRVSRNAVTLRQPCLSLLWLVQPDKVDTMLNERSLTEGGLLPRIMLCHADVAPSKVDRSMDGLPPETVRRWHKLVGSLLEQYLQRRAAPFILLPENEAVRLLDEHQHKIVDRRRGELADADSFAARWNEWAWRLAVVLHAGKHGSVAHEHPVTPDTASAAIEIADWFAEQQLDLLQTTRSASKAKKEDAVMELLRQRPKLPWPRNAVCARDIQRARIAGSADEATSLLSGMEAVGKLVGKDYRPATGGHVVRFFRKAPR